MRNFMKEDLQTLSFDQKTKLLSSMLDGFRGIPNALNTIIDDPTFDGERFAIDSGLDDLSSTYQDIILETAGIAPHEYKKVLGESLIRDYWVYPFLAFAAGELEKEVLVYMLLNSERIFEDYPKKNDDGYPFNRDEFYLWVRRKAGQHSNNV
ncbi:hypothetical protein [Brevibacillus sp. DP1.3A]|uniref:hypothetical protein n=1 Tax=Brevibacillus sp. DP1.3A TaxID=2738867 RepID=UPI00156B2F5C|nr:hypothetical protein [Brevibacillus sp. DP1.3A]UED78074.1 hypothetical protein HP399_030585 [Brevibacillus sp. DP1.3A]